MPLVWLGFTAQKQNNQLVVSWQTSQELSVDHFMVEVSPDGTRFAQRAIVASRGAGSHQYQYTLPFFYNTKQAYIRIVSVDVDGKTAHTPVQLLQNLPSISFSVYPVPAQTQLTIQAAVALTNSTLAIFNGQGQLIRQVKLTGTRYALDITTLPGGPYQLKLYDPEKKLLMEKPLWSVIENSFLLFIHDQAVDITDQSESRSEPPEQSAAQGTFRYLFFS